MTKKGELLQSIDAFVAALVDDIADDTGAFAGASVSLSSLPASDLRLARVPGPQSGRVIKIRNAN